MDWYPWHYKKFREKTLHLTAEQDGIYRRLIDYYMEIRKPIPSDDVALARISGVDLSCFKQASSVVKAFFTEEEGTLKHKTCDEILDEQDRLAKFRTERAKKGAMARHKKTKEKQTVAASSKQKAVLNSATITKTITNIDTNVSITPISPILTSDGRFLSQDMFCDEIWKKYPSVGRGKGHKGKFIEQIKRYLNKGVSHEEIERGVAQYALYCETTGQLNQDAFRWARDKGWETDWEIPRNVKEKPSYFDSLATATMSIYDKNNGNFAE